ncbi:Hypothetical protein FNO222_0014 [Francisella orientalis]|uniref:Uncharacterized protein n=1 Tax=Francisella orientalis TaxID=299583 RepID=A0ABM5U3Z3_9GAMM|nr:hypothetical protein FNO12_0014 [Francisella orientalis FNO12]AKN86377.1 Hypothetical protein FNO24_0014 [Francisella orientalis FNO24]AKN87915.1 Hypothetical protein FNO190_0014 [Francisella orientalis]AKU04668.1 Hypothetical protein FNO01_0014 [Francisella orientalis]QEN19577.1 Hypothetical protein FNO39_0014 [Francisella orientalis]
MNWKKKYLKNFSVITFYKVNRQIESIVGIRDLYVKVVFSSFN